MNNISPNPKGFHETLINEAVEKFIASFKKWDCLRNEKEGMLNFFLSISGLIVHLERDYQIISNPLSMPKFYEICRANEIPVLRDKSLSHLGTLRYEIANDSKIILLKPGLDRGTLLLVAAHELSHFFLHIDKMRDGLAFHYHNFAEPDKDPFYLLTEVEADLLACLLLSGGSK